MKKCSSSVAAELQLFTPQATFHPPPPSHPQRAVNTDIAITQKNPVDSWAKTILKNSVLPSTLGSPMIVLERCGHHVLKLRDHP